MHLMPNKSDSELLFALADFRVLTVSQIAAISNGNIRVVRRRLGVLEDASLVRTMPVSLGRGRGRPERVVSLATGGIDTLRHEGILSRKVPLDHIAPIEPRLLGHQLLVNWFRIRLRHIPRSHSRMAVEFLSPTSPLTPRREDGQPIVCDSVSVGPGARTPTDFTPDGVFSITDRKQSKTLLFFLEADMGTETVASPSGRGGDFRRKIATYQAYFRNGHYKRYEKIWRCELRGFRLLVVTATQARLTALCRLVHAVPPSDFVWLTGQDWLLDRGLASPIWARGGRLNSPPESILGTAAAAAAPITGSQS
jgi:hypothetical protein